MAGALAGLKVLDLSRVLAGPYCTMILSDLGAEVVKVEAPGGSDDTRAWGPPYRGGESAYYMSANRNKKAITVNLKDEQGKEIIKKLIKKSDIVIENFKSGTMERLGLGYEQLKAVNPKIIHCSITGFGKSGPYKDLPGYDYIIQAMGGLMSITGSQESGPMKVGVAIADVLTGLYATVGILAAVNERNESGLGQSIDISLFDSQVSSLVNVASNYLVSGQIPQLLGNLHPNIVPYQTFPTADKQMVIAVGNDRQFSKLTQVIGQPELAGDERFSTNPKRLENKEELIEIISDKLKKRTSGEWLTLLNESGIPAGPINNLEELFQDEQIAARNMVQVVEHPTAGKISLVGSPLKLSRTPAEVRSHPPLAGEHTEVILKELGYSEAEVNQLKSSEVI